MYRGIPQIIGYLCKVVMVFPYKLLGQFDFAAGKIVNNPAVVPLPEKFLELGPSDEVCLADLFDGHMLPDMFIQVIDHSLIEHRFIV